MAEELNPNPKQASTHDAQLAAENMAEGIEKKPEVDVNADYEASKAFSVSEVDRSGKGATAAAEATKPQFSTRQPQETKSSAQPTDNPDDYLDMAREVGHAPDAGSEVTDDMVQKALEKGQPAK